VVLLGIMAGPMMIKSGYDAKMSAGAITAGGTLGILIPPSVMLVVMGPVLGVSVLQLYAAAFGPGFLLAGMYIVYTMTRSFFDPKLGPPVPVEDREKDFRKVIWECIVGLVPVTVLTIATLGVILAGITTSTEAAAMGAAGAILLVIAYGRFSWKGLLDACNSTLATTSMVLFLAVASNIFGAVFARMGTATWITNTLLAIPLPGVGDDDAGADPHLPARLAVRVAGDRAHLPADARRRSLRASATTWCGSAPSSRWCCRPRSSRRRWRCRRTTSSRR
jgi:TRAP-type mannitol/chloroaromatic compound transport system permease large subunit